MELMNNPIIISTEPSFISNNVLRLDVTVKNAPPDLFGAAFDLVIGGPDWSLKRYEAGEVFISKGFEPLMLASEKNAADGHKIITGISLKREDRVESTDGRMITFYLDLSGNSLSSQASGAPDLAGQNLNVSFKNAVLSSLRGGKRVDLSSVQWEKSQVAVPAVSQAAAGQAVAPAGSELTANVSATGGILGQSIWLNDPLVQVYIVLVVTLAIMMVFVGILALCRRLSCRKPPSS